MNDILAHLTGLTGTAISAAIEASQAARVWRMR